MARRGGGVMGRAFGAVALTRPSCAGKQGKKGPRLQATLIR